MIDNCYTSSQWNCSLLNSPSANCHWLDSALCPTMTSHSHASERRTAHCLTCNHGHCCRRQSRLSPQPRCHFVLLNSQTQLLIAMISNATKPNQYKIVNRAHVHYTDNVFCVSVIGVKTRLKAMQGHWQWHYKIDNGSTPTSDQLYLLVLRYYQTFSTCVSSSTWLLRLL